MKKNNFARLSTDFEKDLSSIPFSEYPRPQLKRDSYLCLNGKWNFKIKRGENLRYDGEILVPFAPESRLSGVECEIDDADVMIYERRFTLTDDFMKARVLLHVGACDQYAKVFVNKEEALSNLVVAKFR